MTSSLYRSFLRILEKWPVDPTKKGRDLGEHIRASLGAAFQSGEPRDSNTCQQVQETLQRIANNKYKEAYYVSSASTATGLSQIDCQNLISNEFIKMMEEDDKGTIKGIKDKIFKKD